MASPCIVGTLLRLQRGLLRSVLRPSNCLQTRGAKGWHSTYYRALYKRRLDAGPEPERHRSVWRNWNYDAEIFAFDKRLSENISADTLKTVFTDRSYITKETKERESSGVPGNLDLKDNQQLSQKGTLVATHYIDSYLGKSLPLLPSAGQRAIRDFLLSDDLLSYIARNIGMKDLVLSEEFPVSASTLSKALKALVGGLASEQGEVRAGTFVRDFIVAQLIGKDVNDLWQIVNPMGLLTEVLTAAGRSEPEPRLLRQTGTRTVTAAYMVGIYSDKELVGEAPGETLTVAEEMAARDALKRLFRTRDSRTPFSFPVQCLPDGTRANVTNMDHSAASAVAQ